MLLRRTVFAPFLLSLFAAVPVMAAECDGRFYGEADLAREAPLARPAKPLAHLLKSAAAGDIAAQRSLAISYDTGYLVESCPKKARWWFAKAAAAGDEAAQQWQARDQALAALREGPECLGASCLGSNDSGRQAAVLYAKAARNNHFFAPLTINGKTVEGMIDTGASLVALSPETARLLGVGYADGKQGAAQTANGKIATTTVTVPRLEVAGIVAYNVPVSIGITGEPLIGLSFLNRVNMTVSAGVLTMTRR